LTRYSGINRCVSVTRALRVSCVTFFECLHLLLRLVRIFQLDGRLQCGSVPFIDVDERPDGTLRLSA